MLKTLAADGFEYPIKFSLPILIREYLYLDLLFIS